MQYGQIADNKHVNGLIYRCFEYICEKDQRRFVKKFQHQPHHSSEIMDTYRELILGAYLSANNPRVKYDYIIAGKTPDWCILDDRSVVIGIVESTSFHIDQITKKNIELKMSAKEGICYRRDENKDNLDRLYHCIWSKVKQVYLNLAQQLKVPYVIAVFVEFDVLMDLEEFQSCLFDKQKGLLGMYPEVSGVLYFRESFGQYLFNYTHNPNAPPLAIDLPNSAFPPESP
jgi:hypothetical protein